MYHTVQYNRDYGWLKLLTQNIIPKPAQRLLCDSLDMISHSQVPKSLKFNLKPIQKVAMILKFLFHITFY